MNEDYFFRHTALTRYLRIAEVSHEQRQFQKSIARALPPFCHNLEPTVKPSAVVADAHAFLTLISILSLRYRNC